MNADYKQKDEEEFNEHPDDDDRDEFDEAIENCGGFFDGGVFACMNIGSEQCDWDCPFSRDFGMTKKAIQRRDMREIAGAVKEQKRAAAKFDPWHVICRALVDAFREERDFDGSKIDESWQWAWNEMSEEVMNAWYEKKRVTGELIDKLDELLKARGK